MFSYTEWIFFFIKTPMLTNECLKKAVTCVENHFKDKQCNINDILPSASLSMDMQQETLVGYNIA